MTRFKYRVGDLVEVRNRKGSLLGGGLIRSLDETLEGEPTYRVSGRRGQIEQYRITRLARGRSSIRHEAAKSNTLKTLVE